MSASRVAKRARFMRAAKSGDERAYMAVPTFRNVLMKTSEEESVTGLRRVSRLNTLEMVRSWKLWCHRIKGSTTPSVVGAGPVVELNK